jgi:hypothetical protein
VADENEPKDKPNDGPVPARKLRENAEEDRPRTRKDADDDDDDDDDYEDRPRRRRRRHDDDDDRDETGGLIPYKNSKALMSYYMGVFSLIPCLGVVLAIVAIILGFGGLKYLKKHPRASGAAHAYVGIILGSLVLLGHAAVAIMIAVGAFSR